MQDSLNICWELEATRAAGQAEGLWIPSSVYTHSHRHTYTDSHKHTYTDTHIQMCRHRHSQRHRHTLRHTDTLI